MTRSFSQSVVVAAATACVVAGVTASCGGGARNLCVERNVRCDNPLACDPTDGICKCGGRGGVVCPMGFSCDVVGNTCLSTQFARVDCSDKPGTSVDVYDGVCKCGGTGGQVCAANEVCNPNAKACVPQLSCTQIACGRNQVCDMVTGQCVCGTSTCGGQQACAVAASGDRTCIDDLCSGVTCTGDTACDPADGYCKCNSVVCLSGQSCGCSGGNDAGCASTERVCRAGTACLGVTCGNGTTCDPVDGLCKCGGPGGPACSASQICALGPPPQCQGGQQCALPDGGPKLCAGGSSCDPEDGQCKCGGRGGVVCAAPVAADGGSGDPGQICVQNPTQQVCRRPCDVRSPDCPAGLFCFYDSSAASPAAYCAASTDTRTEDSACTTPTACFSTNPSPRALHCNGLVLGQTGICRPYCDVPTGSSGCIQVPRPQTCVQILGAPAGYGYCQTR